MFYIAIAVLGVFSVVAVIDGMNDYPKPDAHPGPEEDQRPMVGYRQGDLEVALAQRTWADTGAIACGIVGLITACILVLIREVLR